MNHGAAILVLEDGRCFTGEPVGARGSCFGEVIFNTSMTGYQEIASDPSYCGQIVCYTAPQIGNYGVCDEDLQAERPALSGIVVRELSRKASSWRAWASLEEWLLACGIPGITGVDTRALTRHIREHGAMRAGLWSEVPTGTDVSQLVAEVRASPSMEGRNLAEVVSTRRVYTAPPLGERRGRVVLVDFGVKRGILGGLARRGLEVLVVPASTTADEVMAHWPDGVVLSNGPGDPAAVKRGIETAAAVLGRVPLCGICLGHQMIALALGARTYKMRFGHHGGNHPVRDEGTREVWITAQNHGFAVDPDTLPSTVEVTHRSLYDDTLEGFCAPAQRMIAVQFHPEASPGPSDATGIFDRFVEMLRGRD